MHQPEWMQEDNSGLINFYWFLREEESKVVAKMREEDYFPSLNDLGLAATAMSVEKELRRRGFELNNGSWEKCEELEPSGD